MSSEISLEVLFQKWNDLNNMVGASLGQFNFDKIREVREKQCIIEDAIYEVLLENAPEDIKKILPEECNEMEIGHEADKNIFYFLMEDPEYEDSDELKVLAITFNLDKNVGTIKDFKTDD